MKEVFLEYHFHVQPRQPGTDILIARLDMLGFDTIEETQHGLKAYILKGDLTDGVVDQIRSLRQYDFQLSWEVKEIEQQNWNQQWEESFDPILVGDECVIRAPFHPDPQVKYDILITPKMSFGTGHHETTYMMLQFILQQEFKGKSVLDMGTGTGVLAILSAMRGARRVDAIDFDPWCYENAKENVALNKQEHIEVRQGDARLLSEEERYDIIMANINRNTLLQDIPVYTRHLSKGGILILSGFYLDDMEAISNKCESEGLTYQENLQKNDWVSAKYVF